MQKLNFDDATLRELFGTDAAEDDDPQRLKAYFLRNKAYENIRAPLPLRILVGHKGIGKSALLRMSHLEDEESSQLAIFVRPNDLILSDAENMSFIKKIDEYKKLILHAIAQKALDKLHYFDPQSRAGAIESTAKQLIHSLIAKANSLVGGSTDDEILRLRSGFSKSGTVSVYIDDLDRGWSASRNDINNISALINAARDITNEDSRIRIRIGLRSDAYYLFRTSDESTDKVESNVVRLSWNRHDIITVMALRVAHYFRKNIKFEEFHLRSQSEITRELFPIIEERFNVGRGHWQNAPINVVLLSLNRNRPRDLVKLLTQAAQEAHRENHSIITSTDLESVFGEYSQGRITDLILEFRSELPEIEKLLYNMRPSGKTQEAKDRRWLYTNDQLVTKLHNIMQNHNFRFTSGTAVTPKSLAEFLYKIDFIVARSDEGGKTKWTYFDQNRMLKSQFVDFGYHWEVHPAYRWALQPKSVHEILETIALL
ncbi:P-loop ATPase, Sll1717 family [Paracoccus endophyticus]|uniref:P-loop ATPase, Sll1717 family n=1 Tax=Paracoccus endophyticus TaxID=2233774 RepID=UPI0013A6BB35|nr:hypothetical protein [Paracoccus endophyticus]